MAAILAAIAAGLLPGCGPLDDKPAEAPGIAAKPRPVARIIATERGPRGARLVFVSERGERVAPLTDSTLVVIRDNSPSWSPDGEHVVFASSRGRSSLVETSLWIVPARLGGTPRRLTSGDAVDRDPVWTADGTAVVFSSNRAGNFDLWRVEVTASPYGWPVAAGQPEQLTRELTLDLHPSPAPDGRRIVYMAVTPDGRGSRLRLWQDGASTQLTEGPEDLTPAWSPDGTRIAFAAPSQRDPSDVPHRCPHADSDADLYTIEPDGTGRTRVVREPLSDQTGPVWSPDGRYLFATSVYRSVDTCQSLISSITFIDLREPERVLRALHDPVAAEPRTGPTVNRGALDATRLRLNLVYEEALRQAVLQQLERQELERQERSR